MPLSPEEEAQFQDWYRNWAQRLRLNPNPDDPRHFYDYRGAYQAGIEPSPWVGTTQPGSLWGLGQMMPDRAMERAPMHWSSQFKREGHPHEVVGGTNTRTGKRVRPYESLIK